MVISTIQLREGKYCILSYDCWKTLVAELFIRGRKLNISIVFITHIFYSTKKQNRLNSTHYFIIKISNRREPQQIAINHSSDIDVKDFMKI